MYALSEERRTALDTTRFPHTGVVMNGVSAVTGTDERVIVLKAGIALLTECPEVTA
jgi:V8-like Glu-specific endopeptidase